MIDLIIHTVRHVFFKSTILLYAIERIIIQLFYKIVIVLSYLIFPS